MSVERSSDDTGCPDAGTDKLIYRSVNELMRFRLIFEVNLSGSPGEPKLAYVQDPDLAMRELGEGLGGVQHGAFLGRRIDC
jgi:hypothetical protein